MSDSKKVNNIEKNINENVENEKFLRPQRLNEYFGQEQIKKILFVHLKASQNRKESMDHLLLYGPPGLGKTTLARIIANELGVNFQITSGANIERIGDLAALLTNLQSGDILFIDEIHSLPKNVEEILYAAMEDYVLDFIIGKNEEKRTIRIDLPPFSLIGATTKFGKISFPLRDRFGLILKLDFYNIEELKLILNRTSNISGNKIENKALESLARRSRGTPRIANRLFRRVRDFAEVYSPNKVITEQITLQTLDKLQIDEHGLNDTDFQYLYNLVHKFDGGPVGIKNLAVTIGEEVLTIEEVLEPYLIKKGYLKRTSRGRIATEAAFELLKENKSKICFE